MESSEKVGDGDQSWPTAAGFDAEPVADSTLRIGKAAEDLIQSSVGCVVSQASQQEIRAA